MRLAACLLCVIRLGNSCFVFVTMCVMFSFCAGVILNTDIVNATLIHNNEVKCTFPRLTFHYCIVCCHVDPSVPPDSSVYNVSGTNSTVVAVVLTGLIAGQVHHCKVAATDDNRANCFSPVYRNIQTLIQIQPEQVSPGLSVVLHYQKPGVYDEAIFLAFLQSIVPLLPG